MLGYRTPGVYAEWLDTRPPIQAVRSDIAGFVGIAERGPLHTAVRLESWTQYVSVFGSYIPQGYLAYAVRAFFENGGRTCWVVRVADPDRATSACIDLLDDRDRPVLSLEASSPGAWGRKLSITVVQVGTAQFNLTVRLTDGGQEVWRDLSSDTLAATLKTSQLVRVSWVPEDRAADLPRAGHFRSLPSIDLRDDHNQLMARLEASRPDVWRRELSVTVVRAGNGLFDLIVRLADGEQEVWRDLSVTGIARTLDNSQLIRVRWVVNGRAADPPRAGQYRYEPDGLTSLALKHFSGVGAPLGQKWGLAALAEIDEIGILAMPDIMPKPIVQPRYAPPSPRCDVLDAEVVPTVPEVRVEFPPAFETPEIVKLQTQLIAQCERLKDRVAILDAPNPRWSPTEALDWRKRFETKYAALYYPWLRVPDPLELDDILRDVPPSGHVAGVYARVDTSVGVHKPPANESLELAQDVTVVVDDVEHGRLNEGGINALRAYPGRGLRIFGARTLSSETEWRYINVRRLLIVIEESIDQQTQWLVFEPNQAAVWAEADRVVRSFLDDLWQRGWLDGSTAGEAYSVVCDETTNPPAETELGRFICQIGVQPPWPAEFVIVRIGRTENNTHVREE